MPPNIVCTGQVRAVPSLEGIQPLKADSVSRLFPPIPALAGNACRWMLRNNSEISETYQEVIGWKDQSG
jgi:hypothetical protein